MESLNLTDHARHLILLGANHRTCPVDAREAISRRISYRRAAAARARRLFPDLVLLTTCNRIEAYALTARPREAREALLDLFRPEGPRHVYQLEGVDAACHLLRVASGLDSVALGEEQIAAQVRAAPDDRPAPWRRANGLRDLFVRASREAMRIRRLAVPDGGQVSASHAAARYLQKVLPSERPVVALIGSGKMARLAAEALRPRARLLIAHRDPRKAREAAARLEGEPVPLRSIARILRDADAVLAATSSGSPVVRRETVAQAMAARGGRPLWLVDLGFPRNVDPSSGTVPGVTLLNIDDLAPWAWRPPDPAALARAERAIREEAVLAINALRPGPADFVANWRRAANEWRRREIEQALARLPGASQEEREIVEKMADRLTNRILHAPTSLLRRMQAEGQTVLVAELLGAWRDLEGTE